MNDLIYVIKILYALKLNAGLKVRRDLSAFIADRIVQACTESTLLSAIEKFAKLLDADMGKVYGDAGIDFLIAQKKDGLKYLNWLRRYPKIAAMIICLSKWSDIEIAIKEIDIEDIEKESGVALPQGQFDIPIHFTTLAPLSHGSDVKAGNATLFRRMQIMSTTGCCLELPFYAGNAIRGEIRDLLADHLVFSLNIKKQSLAKWFYYIIYSGGSLSENADATKVFSELLGKNGAIKSGGIHQFRDTLPGVSILGSAIGNRILSGRVNICDCRPECCEWANGQKKVSELFEWLYFTRREDNEEHEQGDNSSMIVNTECIKTGVKFHGGIDMSMHISDLEKAALGYGLLALQKKGYIGAANRMGYGKVQFEFDNLPGSELYENFMIENKEAIRNYLANLNVFED